MTPEYADCNRSFRQFSSSQQCLMEEVERYPYVNDKVTSFSLRPPELLFIPYLRLYLSWFIICNIVIPAADEEGVMRKYAGIHRLEDAYWFDGASRIVKVRYYAIPALHDFSLSLLRGEHGVVHPKLSTYVERVIIPLYNNPHSFPQLVDFTNTEPLVVVSPLTLPLSGARWLVHLVLFYGRYTTELELFTSKSLLESFQKAGLYDPDKAELSYKELLSSWGVRELRCLPGSHKSFCRNLCVGKYVLERFFLLNPGEIVYVASPLVILRQLQSAHSVSLKKRVMDSRYLFVDTIGKLNLQNVPSSEQLLQAEYDSPISWTPSIVPADGQSSASVEEQTVVLNVGINKIKSFIRGNQPFIPFLIMAGGPGNGKTTLLLLMGSFGRAQGLEIQPVALSSERSLCIGGSHIHKLFAVSVHKGSTSLSASQAAYYAINRLQRDPIGLAYLLTIDVILLDECGLVDESLFTTMSEILCSLRHTRIPFGGCQVLMTGDPHQLSQIHGNSLWSSVYTHSLFDIYVLQQPVRCGKDPILQKCIQILRKDYLSITHDDYVSLANSIISNCRLRRSIEDVRQESGYTTFEVYSKRISERLAMKSFAENLKLRADAGEPIFVSTSVDEVNESGVSCAWRTSTDNLSTKLNKQSLDAHKLTLVSGVVLRFTRNGIADGIKYSQGQLCICVSLPRDDDDRLEVLIPPPGYRSLQNINLTTPPPNWKRTNLYREYGYDISVGLLLMRRKQYPVVNHVSCTLHRAIGLTLDSVTSRIACPTGASSDRNYCLWEKQQLLVLLSRVASLDRITLINTEVEIRDTVKYLLDKRSAHESYINHVMAAVSKVTTEPPPGRIIIQSLNFRPRRVSEAYVGEGGCVYMLISTQNLNYSYVGQTTQLLERVDTHNRGLSEHASQVTALFHLRPWFVAGVIVGIPFKSGFKDFSRLIRERLEAAWHALIIPTDVPAVVLSKGKSLITLFNSDYPSLTFIDAISLCLTDV